MKENYNIQVLRGFAIIAVVCIHTITGGYSIVLMRPIVNFAVAMFIFLSAYLTPLDIADYSKFYLKRSKRVLIPYIIWSLIYCIAYRKWDTFFYDIFTARACSIYYYIFVYAQFTLLHSFFVKLYKSKVSWIGWIITPLSLLVLRYIPFLWADTVQIRAEIFFGSWFIYYYLGLFAANSIRMKAILNKFNKRKIVIYFCIAYLFSIAEGTFWFMYGSTDMATTQLRISSILTSIITLFLGTKYINSTKKQNNNLLNLTLKILGDCSFGIYLAHPLIRDMLYIIPIWGKISFPISTCVILSLTTMCVLIGKKLLRKHSWLLGF